MVMVDASGRCLEVILRDLGHGPRPWIRVSQRGVLLGKGYYRRIDAALRWVDASSLVEVIDLPLSRY